MLGGLTPMKANMRTLKSRRAMLDTLMRHLDMVRLSAGLTFIVLAGWHDADPLETGSKRWRPTQGFFALILAVEAMVIISFEATDVFLFYIFFEAMLIPLYFLIGGFGDRAHEHGEQAASTQRSYAVSMFGGAAILVAATLLMRAV